MNNLSGQSFGRYHLIEKLGEGGMAVVYKAFDTRLECEVAVKIIRVEDLPQSGVEKALKRFEREAKAVAQLNHPNIVRVMDYGEQDGLPYLVMPYQPGGTLKGLLGKPTYYQEAVHLLAPVARALQYAHSRNIIHRDVKPSNILITESGEPMLTDFGIAKILDLQEGQTLTGTGVGIGTPEYMAPEQWMGEITPAVDIYSLGVVLYELVTGHKPYTADTPAAVLIKTINDPLPRPASYVDELPGEVENVIFKAMAKKAKDRYASMAEFAAALNLLGREERTATPTFPVAVVPPSLEEPDFQTADDLETKESTLSTETKVEGRSTVPPALDQEEPPILKPELPPSFEEPVTTAGRQAWKVLGAIIGVVALLVLIVGGANGWFSAKATPAPTVAPIATEVAEIGSSTTMISPLDGMEMVYVPAGNFIMGSLIGEGDSNELPQHTVYLDAFWIDKTEVTNSMYGKCVDAGICTPPESDLANSPNSYYQKYSYRNYPVYNISWNQANAYCHWVGRNLPTEAQWEKAARGVDGNIYPWGDQNLNHSLANYSSNGPTMVGRYPSGASSYNALDMAGNVEEWVADWYDEKYYSNSPSTNPTGPEIGSLRTIRGGSWVSFKDLLKATSRYGEEPTHSDHGIGFRCSAAE